MNAALQAANTNASGTKDGSGGSTSLSTRGLIIASAVCSAVLTSAGALGVQYYSSLWQQQRTDRATEVTKFVDSAQQFDTLVTRFMRPFIAGRDTSTAKQALRDNLQQQYNLLETAKTHLDERRARRATEYQALIAGIGPELDKSLPAPQAQQLVQAIADARAANVCVIYDLRESAGLQPIPTDRELCERSLPPQS
ncbi:MAG TPA: hypothetical protein VGB79_10035 [Allosphingosinicella sp.]|jgi:hypothetical protein